MPAKSQHDWHNLNWIKM